MSNGLTGGFDAVILVRLPVVNGLLAALHRNGGSEAKSPSLLHSFTIPVGVPGFSSASHQILAWAQSYKFAGDVMQAPEKGFHHVPPGVFQEVESAQLEYQRVRDALKSLHAHNGYGEVQASVPSVHFRPGATSEVTSTFRVRARFLPTAGSEPLPAPIHGEVNAGFTIDVQSSSGPTIILAVAPSSDDGDIQFMPAPGTGLSAADAEALSSEIRYALRHRFEPMTLELDAAFPFSGFKALGLGNDQVVALPAMLDGGSAPTLAGVGEDFLDTADHFGIGVGKAYINPRLQPMLDSLEQISFTQTIEFIGITVATYNVSVSSASLAWKPGELEVTVHGSAVTGSIFPNYNFTVKQRLTLVFDPGSESITLVAVGDPTITGLPSDAADEALPVIKNHRDAAIAAAQPQIAAALAEVSMDDALSSFDGAPRTHLTGVDIRTDGLILHGRVELSGASYAQIDIEETADGNGFTALGSWMPGGWIESYLWSWKEAGFMQNPWGGTVHSEVHEHVFTIAKPTADANVASMCLAVEGTQVTSTGSVIPVEGGEVCKVSQPSWMVATMPKWWDLFLPIWEIDPSPEEALDESILAHVNMNAHATNRARLGANTIVHFGGGAEAPLDALGESLSGLGSAPVHQLSETGAEGAASRPPLAICLVLPRSAFSRTRAVLEKEIGSLPQDVEALLTITEDYEGRWSRAFAHEKGPGTYLLNARGEFAWHHQGEPGPRAFSEMRRHLLAGSPLRYHPLRLAVSTGDRAPDLLFPLADGRRMALRRLRGRRVKLLFLKSWSAPCRRELSRLEERASRDPERSGVVLAIHAGEDSEPLAGSPRGRGDGIVAVPDPRGLIARRYDVPCWPTTVSIDEDGIVEGVHFGTAPRAMRTGAS